MHILYATQAYKPAYRVGGPIVSVSAGAEELVRRGHRVSVVASSADVDQDLDVPLNQPVNVDGVEVWYFRANRTVQRKLRFIPYLAQSAGFLYSSQMRAAIERLIPDVDVVHTQVPYVYPVLAAGRAALRHRKPLIYQARGAFLPEALRRRKVKKSAYITVFERPLMRSASSLVALTKAEIDSYRGLGVNTKCEVIPNGVHVGRYGRQAVQCELPIPSDRSFILFLGRLHATKGVERLLEAFALVHSRIPKTVLVLAGPDELGLEKNFRAMARHGEVQDKVFFPGMLSGALKQEFLSRAALFCLPSKTEGFSMAVLEALASGTPVLLSPGCNFPEVAPAGAGLVVSTDPKTLGEAIVTMLSDSNRLREMGQLGRAFVQERYSWGAVVDQLTALYSEVCSRPSGIGSLQPSGRVVDSLLPSVSLGRRSSRERADVSER